MVICSACGTENRDAAKFCHACGNPLAALQGPPSVLLEEEGSGLMVEAPAVEVESPDPRTELLVGVWPPGALLQERYEIIGLVARQADHATYRVYDRGRCPACGACLEPAEEAEGPAGEGFCPGCGAELAQPAICLLREWLTPPETIEGETFESAGRTFSVEIEKSPEERPFAQGVHLTAGLRSAKGPELEINQDSLLALTLSPVYEGRPTPALGLFAVADGIGGHQAGEVASRIAVQVLAQELVSGVLMAELGGDICLVETLIRVVGEAVAEANAQIYAVAQSGGSDMGSTITTALVRDDLAVVANVGDSRVYHWHDGKLDQVTTDHSLVERLVAAGEVAPEEAAAHPQKSVLYRSLGDRPAVEVDVLSLRLASGDRLLLCCDGVWESIGDEGLEEVMLLEFEPQRICDQVVRRSLESGASDNVSVIVIGVADLGRY
ncbi:MAG: protein phosphatase 2C domain-containing protein [Anaerolineae bacterium]|nr:protein phosphatase 2C domain-containing protein [Anaerolineae bacterium]